MADLDPELYLLLDQRRKAAGLASPSAAEDTSLLQISVAFVGSPDGLRAAGMDIISVVGSVAYGQASMAALAALADLATVTAIEKQRRKYLTLDSSVPDVRANQAWSRSGGVFTNGGEGVIVGIVDTGIDFSHLNFRKPNGDTRLLRIWDQTITVATGESSPGPVSLPSADPANPTMTLPLGYGVEYADAQINTYLHNPPITPPVRHEDQDGHGTHVAGIAAGNGAQSGGCHLAHHYVGVAPAADVIMVRKWGLTKKLEGHYPGDGTKPPAGAGNTMIDAIAYILNVAKTLTPPKPVVINLSLGSFSSKMDGTSNDSKAMDNLLLANSTGFAIVFAAGNDGAGRFHAQGVVPAGPAAATMLSFQVTIAPQDTDSRTIVVLYTGNNLQMRVTSGTGTTGWVATGGPTPASLINGVGSATIINSSNRISLLITPLTTPPVAPATTPTNSNNTAGNWTIDLQDTGSTATSFDAFCLFGSTHDPKSPFFTRPTAPAPDLVTNQSTLTEEATTREVLSVGSYSAKTGELAVSSGRGMTLDRRMKPEITAPGVGIKSTANAKFRAVIRHDDDCDCCANCCCTCCADFYMPLSGTSMAAPHVAGAAALLFQRDKTLTHTQITNHLFTTARTVTTPVLNDQLGWGGGKLDVKAAVDRVVSLLPAPALAPAAPMPAPTPVAALPPAHTELLQDRLMRHPRFPEFRALYDRYGQEVRTLIDTNKRVATVWHRCGGPAWVRVALQLASMPTMPIPAAAGGCSLHEGIARLRAVFERYGSDSLARDITQYMPDIKLVDSGMSLLQLVNLFEQRPVPTPVNP